MTEFDYRVSSNIHDDLTTETVGTAHEGEEHCAHHHSKTEEVPLAAALSLAKQGIPVFPCRASKDETTGEKAKNPFTTHGFKDATTDDKTIRSWWTKWPDAMIGMPTGEATGTLVVDVDEGEGKDGKASLAALEKQHGPLPTTKCVRTPSGGEHIYFALPEKLDIRCSASKIGPDIDVRANGGYVIVPPSQLKNAAGQTVGCYEYIEKSPTALAEPPEWLTVLTQEKPKAASPPHNTDNVSAPSWVKARLDTLCATASEAKPGTRNDTLNKTAFVVGQMVGTGSLPQAEAENALLAAALLAGLPEAEARSTITSGIEAGIAKPPERPFFHDLKDTGSISNLRAFLAWHGVELRHNDFLDRIELYGLKGHRYLNDKSIAELWGKAHEIGFRVGKNFLRDCLDAIALDHRHHPVLDYFEGLDEWDGIPRLDMWLTAYLKAEDNAYISSVGAKTLIAAVRRIKKPGTKFDQLLILEGKQGKGKSSALSILAMRDSWFTDCVSLTHDSKHLIEQTEGKLIVEVPELKGMRKAEIEHVKATLSRTHDRARKAWGHYADDVPRQFILIGTTNTENGGGCWYLKDPTGNRRFWPVRTGEIDLERLGRDRDQLWAEAIAREAEGEPIELPRDLWEDAQREQQARMERDPWVEELTNSLSGKEGKLLTTDARLIVSRNLDRWGPYQNERLGRAMRELGWERKELRTDESNRGRAYFYVKGDAPWRKVIVTVESSSQVNVYEDKSQGGARESCD